MRMFHVDADARVLAEAVDEACADQRETIGPVGAEPEPTIGKLLDPAGRLRVEGTDHVLRQRQPGRRREVIRFGDLERVLHVALDTEVEVRAIGDGATERPIGDQSAERSQRRLTGSKRL